MTSFASFLKKRFPQFFWLGDPSTSGSFTSQATLVFAGFVLPYSGATAPGFHGILSLRATQ